MSPVTAALIAAALLALATVGGIVLRSRDGVRRSGRSVRFDPADAHPAALGSRATLVQFSTDMCSRCPQVRRMLGAVSAAHDGLEHVEIDLTHRPDLSHRYRVLQTPTTLVVDASGAVRARFHGVPHRHAVAEVVASL